MVRAGAHVLQVPLRVLVTGAGAPGIAGTVHALRHNPQGEATHVVAVDMDPSAVGRYFADGFHVVPAPEQETYLQELMDVCRRERVDVVLPQTTRETAALSRHRALVEAGGVAVAVADAAAVERANDKRLLLEAFRELGLPHPDFRVAASEEELVSHTASLGYPENPVVVKPPISNGMRGLRVLREQAWDADRFLREKPSGIEISLDELLAVLRRGPRWPELLVTDYLPGDEYTVDAFLGEAGAIAVPRRRRAIRSGISFDTVVEWRKDLTRFTLEAARHVGLRYAFGFQFKLDAAGVPKVLECNPRVQGTMAASTFAGVNCIWLAVQEALGRSPTAPAPVTESVAFKRYWGGVAIVGDRGEVML